MEKLITHEHINLKGKVKLIDTHPTNPWIVFCDSENNLFIYDINENKVLRAFNIVQYTGEPMSVKDIRFYNINDRKFVNSYEINEVKKVKGIPLHQRAALLIITLEKFIYFYSYLTQNIVKNISNVELEQKIPLKCEVFNSNYLFILTSDGNLIIWNMIDWGIVKMINKSNVNKPISNFIIFTNKFEERYVACANSSGNLFLIDVTSKGINYNRLETDKVNIFKAD
jgi:WD40 repeat protein